MTALLRAALAGAASGERAFTGLAALTLATPPAAVSQPDRTLSAGRVKSVVALLAAGELAADKLPITPSRLEPPGLGMRCVAGAVAGLIIARRAPEPGVAPSTARTVACAAVATAAAVGAAVLGTRWRGWAVNRFGHDYVGAGLEDALAVGLASLSARR